MSGGISATAVIAGAAVLSTANSMGAFGKPGGPGGGGGAGGGMTYEQYDPFGANGGRKVAADQLKSYMADPSSTYGLPGFQMQLKNGRNQVQAAGAANGTLQSGAQLNALDMQGQSTFGNYYDRMVGYLSMQSGANQAPGQAAGNYSSASTQGNSLSNNMRQQDSANLYGAGATLAGLFGNKSNNAAGNSVMGYGATPDWSNPYAGYDNGGGIGLSGLE